MSNDEKIQKIFENVSSLKKDFTDTKIELARFVTHQERDREEIKALTLRAQIQDAFRYKTYGAIGILGILFGALVGYVFHLLGVK